MTRYPYDPAGDRTQDLRIKRTSPLTDILGATTTSENTGDGGPGHARQGGTGSSKHEWSPVCHPASGRLRVLVACEFSGIVRDAFRDAGHYAVSCDLLPTERPGPHFIGDVRWILHEGWDLLVAHPPCTHLAVSGARWFKDKQREQAEALEFVRELMDAPVPNIAIENPISVISSRIRKPDQIIQPWQFGHGETKAVCLWLKNLPPLEPTNIVEGREARVHRMAPGPDRWKERSRFFPGIADAMARQWTRAILAKERAA